MSGRLGRRLFLGASLVAGLLLLLTVTVLPGIAERSFNRVITVKLPSVSSQAQAIHDGLFVADLHADTLLWNRDLSKRSSRGHVDLPRLRDGNVGLQVFSAVIKTPRGQNYHSNRGDSDALRPLLMSQLWPPSTWSGLEARAHYQAERLVRAARRSEGRLRIVRSRQDLTELVEGRRQGREVVGGLLAIEGLQALEGDLSAVDRLYDAGYRMMGLAHFYDNAVAGSAHGVHKGGLTALGREVLQRLEDLRIIVDLAHAAPATTESVLSIARRPVVVSHTGVQATCPGNRNLSDEQIRAVAANGGVIGVGYWDGAVCDSTPAAIVAAMRHVTELVGIEHVALGSDYDGATEVSFDTSRLAVLTEALLQAEFEPAQIHAIMGGNVASFLLETLPPE